MSAVKLARTSAETPRRTVLRGALLTGAVMPVLAACGGDEEPATSGESSSDQSSSGPAEQSPSEQPPTSGGEVIASTDDVPEGGGLIVEGAEVVITQPKAGTFLCFTSVCTHQGCAVSEVADGSINCPCHGSKFSIEDGSVVAGPATSPLPETPIVVSDKEIILA